MGADTQMILRDFFSPDAIALDLKAQTRDDALRELVSCWKLNEQAKDNLFAKLKRRENLGSTGIGREIAIPHCRSLEVTRLRIAFGRRLAGLDFKATDEKPVRYIFLIVAPPSLEASNHYLPVLGRIAHFAKERDVPDALAALESPSDFLTLLAQKTY